MESNRTASLANSKALVKARREEGRLCPEEDVLGSGGAGTLPGAALQNSWLEQIGDVCADVVLDDRTGPREDIVDESDVLGL